MSYSTHYTENTNTLSQLFSTINDCLQICDRMYASRDNVNNFMRWYEKARRIDSRTTYLYLKEKGNDFNKECHIIFDRFLNKVDMQRKNDLV